MVASISSATNAINQLLTPARSIRISIKYEPYGGPAFIIDLCLDSFKQIGDPSAWLDVEWDIRPAMMREPDLQDYV